MDDFSSSYSHFGSASIVQMALLYSCCAAKQGQSSALVGGPETVCCSLQDGLSNALFGEAATHKIFRAPFCRSSTALAIMLHAIRALPGLCMMAWRKAICTGGCKTLPGHLEQAKIRWPSGMPFASVSVVRSCHEGSAFSLGAGLCCVADFAQPALVEV